MARSVVIVGLGNHTHPTTRHSIGQLVLDSLWHRITSSSSTMPRLENKHPGWVASTSHQSIDLHFFKPKVAMNLSGRPIRSFIRSLHHPPPLLLLLHDDIDLPPLKLRLRAPPKSHLPRGHNGLRSTFSLLPPNHASSPRFYTLGIGIGRGSTGSKASEEVGKWVMGPLMRDELDACRWHHPDDGRPRKGGEVVEEVWRVVREEVLPLLVA